MSPIAERSVSIRVRLKIAEFEAGSKGIQRNLTGVNRKLTETAGFAAGMRKKLEDATKKLPKIEIDANSKPAEIKVAELRAKLEKLAAKDIEVDADVTQALIEMSTLQRELAEVERGASFEVRADIGAALTQLRGIQQEVDRISGESARVDVDADTAQAQQEVADLRRRLDELNARRRIGVDLDAGAAKAELSAIQRDLQRLNATSADVKVRADTAQALAQIRAVSTETSRMSGRSANISITADGSRALLVIAAVAAAVASLPAAATISIGVGVLGGALSAAGLGAVGFAAAAVPAIGRVNEALKETESAAGGAGGAMKSAAQAAAEAAAKALSLAQAQDRVKDSATAVKTAQQGVRDALRNVRDAQEAYRTAQENAALAAERVSEAQAAGAARVSAAERSLADAHRATQMAVEDLTRARERAIERIEDLELATKRGALDEEGANIAIERAKMRLDAINADPKSTDLSKREADLAYREALQRLEEVRERNGDLTKEKAESDRKGVEGSDEVTAAKERLIDAQRREAEAAQAVGEAQAQAAQGVAAAQRDAAQASQDAARALRDIGDAQRKVAEAQQAVIKAQRDELRARQALRVEQLQQKAAMEQAGAAAGGAATKMSKLSKEERQLAKDIKAFTDTYEKWQQSLQPAIFPTIRSGMDLLTTGMEVGTPLIKASAFALGTLAEKANAGLKGEQWTEFFDTMTRMAPLAIDGLGTSVGNLLGGVAGIFEAMAPKTADLMTWLKDITQEFENWGQGLSTDTGFAKFMAYVEANAPKVQELLGNLGTAIGNILSGASDPGAGLLDFLVGVSAALAKMTPEQYEAVAKALGLIVAAVKLGMSLKLGVFVLLAENLNKLSPGQIEAVALAIGGLIVAVKGYQAVSAAAGVWSTLAGGIDKAGDAATRNKGKLAGLGELGGAAAGALAVTTGLGMLDNQLTGLDTKLGAMSSELTEFAKTGQLSGKLAEQWGDSLGAVVTDVGSWDEALGRASGTSESFREAISRLANPGPLESFKSSYLGLMNTVTLGTTEFDKSAEQIGFIDQELANLVSSGRAGEAEQAFARLTKEAQAMGVPVSALKDVFPQYSQAMTTAGVASNEAAGGIDAAKQKVDGLQASLDTFAARTDALQAVRNMETAYRDAAAAIEASSGKLDFNTQMTDKQRDAVILAREAFSGYLEKVGTGAEAQEKLSGRTGDATIKVAEQLPRLMELAGKSAEAKEQVYQLAEKFGLSREMADKAAGGSKNFKAELDKLKDKQVKIELDTKEALDKAYAFAKQLLGIKLELPIGIRAPAAPRAYGGIYNADGRQYMASGGIRSLGSSPAAMIASSPYMISGRAGPDVVFGEAGMEAYIPLSTGKRDRGLKILQEAAGIMGMAVVPEKVGVNTAGSTSGASGGSFSGGGAAMVTVTGIDALRSALDTTALDLTGSLGGATSTLDATLGDAGTLTQSLTGVGEITGHLAGEVTGWGEVIAEQVPPLTDAVTLLGDAISAAASGDAKGGTGSKGDERSPRSSGAKTAAEQKKIMLNTIAGHTSAAGSGVVMSGGSNWSTTSRPVQMSQSGWAPPPQTSAASSGPLLNIENFNTTEHMSADEVATRLSFKIGERG
ncbi:hypothetical protein [Streptosporangium sp. G12]